MFTKEDEKGLQKRAKAICSNDLIILLCERQAASQLKFFNILLKCNGHVEHNTSVSQQMLRQNRSHNIPNLNPNYQTIVLLTQLTLRTSAYILSAAVITNCHQC